MATSLPNEKPGNLIMVGIPSKNGLYSTQFTASLLRLQTTINTSLGWNFVIGKLVDDARNDLVEMAKVAGAKYILFIDDDTLIPHYAIPRFLNMNVKVASGVYYTKSQPPTPVILKKNIPGGFTNWKFGDVIEVDYVGLGCTFIDMSIFDKLTKPYFKFQKCSDNKAQIPCIGEDVWFCRKVQEEAGEKIWVDTYIQCGHEDFAKKTTYFYHEGLGRGAWIDASGKTMYIPEACAQSSIVAAKDNVKVCWGYDAEAGEYEEAGTVDLEDLRKKYAKIAAVKMRKVLEYRTNEETIALLTTIYNLMAPGAPIEIYVPDSARRLAVITPDASVKQIDAFMGDLRGKYRSIYTDKYMQEIAALLGFKDISISQTDGDFLMLKAVK